MDAVVDFLPSPSTFPAGEGSTEPDALDDSSAELTRERPDEWRRFPRPGVQDHDRPLRGSAHVHPGVLRCDEASGSDDLQLDRSRRKERIGRLLKMHANKREDIKQVSAG